MRDRSRVSGGSGLLSSWVTDSAPCRRVAPRQSAPVSPPVDHDVLALRVDRAGFADLVSRAPTRTSVGDESRSLRAHLGSRRSCVDFSSSYSGIQSTDAAFTLVDGGLIAAYVICCAAAVPIDRESAIAVCLPESIGGGCGCTAPESHAASHGAGHNRPVNSGKSSVAYRRSLAFVVQEFHVGDGTGPQPNVSARLWAYPSATVGTRGNPGRLRTTVQLRAETTISTMIGVFINGLC